MSDPNPCPGGVGIVAMTAEPLACVVAHQDDEVMVSARITRRTRVGAPVRIVFTTSAGCRLGAVREKEALVAADVLGVPRSNLVFLRHQDGASYREAKTMFDEVAELLSSWRPTDVFTCAYEGGHIDHDIANMVTAAAANRACPWARLHEFPWYNAFRRRFGMVCGRFIPSPVPVDYLPLTAEDQEVKSRLWTEAYKSQRVAVGLMRLAFEDRDQARRGEATRRLPRYDYLMPPHCGELGYERYRVASFSDFKRAALSVPGPWAVGALRRTGGCQTDAWTRLGPPVSYAAPPRGELDII